MSIIYTTRTTVDIDKFMANENQKIIFTKEQIEEAFNKGLMTEKEAQEAEQHRIKLEAEAKRQAELKKKAALPPPKFYYDVKVECMLPATLTYRVYAETPQQAAEMIKGIQPTTVKHKLIGRKEVKLMVYDAGSTMIRFIKNLFGG